MPRWEPKSLDLILSATIALFFPFIAQILYINTGALIPMILYYSLAWAIVKGRRGSTGYFNKPKTKYPISFFANLLIIIISLYFAFQAKITSPSEPFVGILFTAVVWATVNAASEQLLWIYIFESWDLYMPENVGNTQKTWLFRIIGLLLFTAFIGLIHTLFWTQFLHTVDSTLLFGLIFVIATSISGYLHIIVWRESNQMIFTFIPHFLLNLSPLLWTGYSILPYLVNIT